jgi:folate-binding protein YgfZ
MAYPLLLHASHAEGPVMYQPLGQWVVPWRLTSFEAEYQALRAGASLIDYSTLAVVEVAGADRAAFLHNLLTNDIKRLGPGGGCHAFLLNANGKLIAEVRVLMMDQTAWLLCDATRASELAKVLEGYVFSEAVTITNHERAHAVFAIEGPQTMAALSRLTRQGESLPGRFDHAASTMHGAPVRLVRDGLAGGLGVLCIAEAGQAKPLWQALTHAAADAGLRPAGWEALNAARIETGIPWWGLDMTEDNLLPETGLETSAASDSKGCYVGQEIVARMATYGSANKKLVGLLIEGSQMPEPGDQLLHHGEDAGRVTSAYLSPSLKRPIALGYVKRGAYEVGTKLELVCRNARLDATVAARPMIG